MLDWPAQGTPIMNVRRSKLTLRSRLVMASFIILAYSISCFLPALAFTREMDPTAPALVYQGWEALAVGWAASINTLNSAGSSLRGALCSASWWANILLWLDLAFLVRGLRRATLISSGLTLLLGLGVFGLFSTKYYFYSAGIVMQSLLAGAWVWLGSLGMAFLAALILFFAPTEARQVTNVAENR
jgi:hypothetical protein